MKFVTMLDWTSRGGSTADGIHLAPHVGFAAWLVQEAHREDKCWQQSHSVDDRAKVSI